MTKVLGGIVLVVAIVGAGALYVQSTNSQSQTAAPVTTSLTPTNPSPTTVSSGYTLAMVAQHADASSCWTAINGKVYDLTNWINQHPGGPDRILSICGKDGSSVFNAQHGGQSRPTNELATFYLGPLSQ